MEGRVTPKAKGSGEGLGIRNSGLGLTPQEPGQQGLGQGEIPTTPGTGSSRPGGSKSEKSMLLQREVTWSNIMQTGFYHIRLFVHAVYDVLPSSTNPLGEE